MLGSFNMILAFLGSKDIFKMIIPLVHKYIDQAIDQATSKNYLVIGNDNAAEKSRIVQNRRDKNKVWPSHLIAIPCLIL